MHPYTTDGLQIDVDNGGEWVEIGECGLAATRGPARAPDSDGATGLAMGLGLDRLLMLRKGIADIRLLRAADPRVAAQMRDLSLYRPVSNLPAITRDLSIAVAADVDAELLGDRVREALGADADCVEAVEVLSETPGERAAAGRAGSDSGCNRGRRTCSCASCSGMPSARSRVKRRTMCASVCSARSQADGGSRVEQLVRVVGDVAEEVARRALVVARVGPRAELGRAARPRRRTGRSRAGARCS